jgi:hypothetical protein
LPPVENDGAHFAVPNQSWTNLRAITFRTIVPT